ncbi:MAG: DUF5009 domain-containing protein [Verrucomicrobia bacterium]|nr:DUF5009 domain-containing protein [Verrucomicrobiota bacterium]
MDKMKTERIGSVDILRGLTIFLMVFVNTHIPNAPWWMKHFPQDQSGMTFADVIFPAFLLIMGMSIPLSVGRSLDKGVPRLKIIGSVLLRSFSLIVLGLLEPGMNVPDPTVMGGTVPLWGTLVCLSFFAVWHSCPTPTVTARRVSLAVRVLGIAFLLYYIASFRSPEGVWLETKFWGILGILGWSYLIVSFIYMVLRNQRDLLLLASFMLLSYYIATKQGFFPEGSWLSGSGSLFGGRPGIVMMGAALGSLLVEPMAHGKRLRWIFGFALLTGMIALFLEPLYGIGKVKSTPTWIYASVAITALVWIPIYWLRDVRGRRGGAFGFLTGLGHIPLTIYLFHPLVMRVMTLTGLHHSFEQLGAINLGAGIVRTLLLTAGVCWIPLWLFRKYKFVLKV